MKRSFKILFLLEMSVSSMESNYLLEDEGIFCKLLKKCNFEFLKDKGTIFIKGHEGRSIHIDMRDMLLLKPIKIQKVMFIFLEDICQKTIRHLQETGKKRFFIQLTVQGPENFSIYINEMSANYSVHQLILEGVESKNFTEGFEKVGNLKIKNLPMNALTFSKNQILGLQYMVFSHLNNASHAFLCLFQNFYKRLEILKLYSMDLREITLEPNHYPVLKELFLEECNIPMEKIYIQNLSKLIKLELKFNNIKIFNTNLLPPSLTYIFLEESGFLEINIKKCYVIEFNMKIPLYYEIFYRFERNIHLLPKIETFLLNENIFKLKSTINHNKISRNFYKGKYIPHLGIGKSSLRNINSRDISCYFYLANSK